MTWNSALASLMAALALAMPLSVGAQPARTEPHRQLLMIALDNLGRARCEGGQPCAPATVEERATPPITDDQARAVVEAGSISVVAEHCGLDWQRRNFEPLMKHHRERLRMSERQLALVSLLHGITMGVVGETVRRTPPRTEGVNREAIDCAIRYGGCDCAFCPASGSTGRICAPPCPHHVHEDDGREQTEPDKVTRVSGAFEL